jgi:protein TonB
MLSYPAKFIKKKYRYITIQFFDDYTRNNGITSFKLENKQLLDSVAATLAGKAGLVLRGEIYVKPNPTTSAAVAETLKTPSVAVEGDTLGNRVISLPRPFYPQEARKAQVTGTVRVLVTVDEQGNVAEAEAISGPPPLQDAAIEAARQAKFEPIMRDGRAVKTRTVIRYNFTLT